MSAESLTKLETRARSARAARRVGEWVIPTVRAGLITADILVTISSFLLAFYLREGSPVFANPSNSAWSQDFEPYGIVLIFIVPIRFLTHIYYDLYRLRGEFSYVDEGIRIFKATAIGSLLGVAIAFLHRGGFEFRNFSYSRAVFIIDFLLVLSALVSSRLIVRGIQTFVRRLDMNLIPTLVVGCGPEAILCIKEMRECPELGYRVIGIVDTDDADGKENFEGVPVLGTIGTLPEVIREAGANEVVITDPKIPSELLFDVMIRVGRTRSVEFRIIPNLFNCLPRKTDVDQIGALPMILLFREPLSDLARIVKRTSDILISLLALILLAPLWILISILIKLDSKGPVFFKQERVGMDGRIFLLYKFRTMLADADQELHREYQKRHITGQLESSGVEGEESRPVYGKIASDPRITRIGRILRRYSLDELPQLFNVLRGSMSVVGPRPPIPYEVEIYEIWQRKRLDMKPGITGLWQVSGRNSIPFEEMVRLDLFYIENWSLLLDLRIIIRTLPVIIRGKDTY
jgi:exopolysaccharide biosynthesis polyprenyl glycosylphosphotransferase